VASWRHACACISGQGLAAGLAQDLAGDVIRFLRCEDDVRGCQLGGLPGPPQWVCSPNNSTFSSGMVAGMSGVQIGPGATELTRIPFSVRPAPNAFVNATIQPGWRRSQAVLVRTGTPGSTHVSQILPKVRQAWLGAERSAW
jgi:hypothetical protein